MQHIRKRLQDSYTVYAFAGKDGLFGTDELNEPDARALKDFLSAIGIGVKTVLDIDRHDHAVEGTAVVDDWLTALKESA